MSSLRMIQLLDIMDRRWSTKVESNGFESNEKILRYIDEHPGEVDQIDKNGYTPYHWILRYARYPASLLTYILPHVVDPNTPRKTTVLGRKESPIVLLCQNTTRVQSMNTILSVYKDLGKELTIGGKETGEFQTVCDRDERIYPEPFVNSPFPPYSSEPVAPNSSLPVTNPFNNSGRQTKKKRVAFGSELVRVGLNGTKSDSGVQAIATVSNVPSLKTSNSNSSNNNNNNNNSRRPNSMSVRDALKTYYNSKRLPNNTHSSILVPLPFQISNNEVNPQRTVPPREELVITPAANSKFAKTRSGSANSNIASPIPAAAVNSARASVLPPSSYAGVGFPPSNNSALKPSSRSNNSRSNNSRSDLNVQSSPPSKPYTKIETQTSENIDKIVNIVKDLIKEFLRTQLSLELTKPIYTGVVIKTLKTPGTYTIKDPDKLLDTLLDFVLDKLRNINRVTTKYRDINKSFPQLNWSDIIIARMVPTKETIKIAPAEKALSAITAINTSPEMKNIPGPSDKENMTRYIRDITEQVEAIKKSNISTVIDKLVLIKSHTMNALGIANTVLPKDDTRIKAVIQAIGKIDSTINNISRILRMHEIIYEEVNTLKESLTYDPTGKLADASVNLVYNNIFGKLLTMYLTKTGEIGMIFTHKTGPDILSKQLQVIKVINPQWAAANKKSIWTDTNMTVLKGPPFFTEVQQGDFHSILDILKRKLDEIMIEIDRKKGTSNE